jgi:hypothetical protein
MKDELNDAKEQMRNAARAGLLMMRSKVDARIRRIEQKQARARAGADAPTGGRRAEAQRPHEIVSVPLDRSFDEAWRGYTAGGALVPLEEQRAHLSQGRAQLLAFHAPMDVGPVQALAAQVIDALADVEGLLPLPDDLLHCSIRAAGFQVIRKQRPDDVQREDIGPIVSRAQEALRRFAPVAVDVGPVNVFPDALVLEVRHDGALAAVRDALGPVVGADAFGIDDTQYLAHVSIAFFADARCGDALRERLPALRELPPVAVAVRQVDFVRWWLLDDEAAADAPERDIIRAYPLRTR